MERGAKLVMAAAALSASCAVSCAASRRPPPPRRAAAAVRDARSDFRPTAWQAFSSGIDVPRRRVVRELLCAATSPELCEGSCLSLSPHDAAACALDLAYADDDDARALAHDLFAVTGAVPGVERWHEISAAYLGSVRIHPVLPVGQYRRHLVWLRDALADIEGTFAELAPVAPEPVLFRTRPHGFRFFRTASRSYPSAYAIDGIVGYNVEGPLHDSLENVTATLLHELFHLNDEGHGQWSQSRLSPVFDRIVKTCGADHECFTPFAPSDDRVPGGTYYAFDPGVRDVREYAAELALRWFREQRTVSEDGSLPGPAFKCATGDNALAWRLVVDEFFGGLDLTPPCAGDPPAGAQDT